MLIEIKNFLAAQFIVWLFIPPFSSHFGGLCGAVVKRLQHHSKRITSKVALTFEELYTICTQIEALLNSRPLSPLSSNPNDLHPLTPAHFLSGKPLIALDEDVIDVSMNRLNRFQLVLQIVQHFW